ncbi:hypothetical protein HYE68_008255 [Fusarium pseudograminearum]|nr:hypothetical protein HYE68_008255 [Fusarium pseudograminearum]
MRFSFALVAALAGHAAATPCPPWLVVHRSSWRSATTRIDKILAAMPTLYPGGLTAPLSVILAAEATATTTDAENKAAATPSATVGSNEISSTEALDSSTASASPSASSGDSVSDSNASSTEEVSVTRTTTTITVTPTVFDITSASESTLFSESTSVSESTSSTSVPESTSSTSVSESTSASDTASASDTSSAPDTASTSSNTLAFGTTTGFGTTSGLKNTSRTTASTNEDSDSDLDRRDETIDKTEEQTDEDETLAIRTQQAIRKLREAYELQELFNMAVLKWGRSQEEQERQRNDLKRAEKEVERRVKAAVDFAKEVQADTEAFEKEYEEEEIREEKKNRINKRDKINDCGCGNKNGKRDKVNDCGCGNKNEKRQDRINSDLEHEKHEDELYAGIGDQLEDGLVKDEDRTGLKYEKPVYLITKQFKVYKCEKLNGCELYDVRQVDDEGPGGNWNTYEDLKKYKERLSKAKEDYKEDFEKNIKKMKKAKSGEKTVTSIFEIEKPEKEVEEKGDEKGQAHTESPLLAGGDEAKQYERISMLYMQYRGMLVEPIQKDLDPILRNSKYEEDKEMASQYQEGNEKEQRQRLRRLYMDYRYMLVPKWQKLLDPILWADN